MTVGRSQDCRLLGLRASRQLYMIEYLVSDDSVTSSPQDADQQSGDGYHKVGIVYSSSSIAGLMNRHLGSFFILTLTL